MEEKRSKLCYPICSNMKLENLPDEIIHKIMQSLPYKEATKFSILSRSFYSSWLSFPALGFSFRPIFSDVPYHPKPIFSPAFLRQTFLKDVKETLQLRGPYIKGSLNTLNLYYTELLRPNNLRYPKVLDVLLSFAVGNNVRVLNFNLNIRRYIPEDAGVMGVDWNYDSLRPPFSSSSLTVLKLTGVKVPWVDDAVITCPKLEELLLTSCEGFQTMNVSSPSLKKVQVKSCRGLKAFQILFQEGKGSMVNSFKHEEGHDDDDQIRQCTLDIKLCRELEVLKVIDDAATTTTTTEEFSCCSIKKLSLDLQCGLQGDDEMVIDIDAPNLVELNCVVHGNKKLGKLRTSAKCGANISLLAFDISDIPSVRDFFCCFDHIKDLSISCSIFQDMIIPELAFQVANVSLLYDLRHLKIEARRGNLPIGPSLICLLKSLLKLVLKPGTITFYSQSTNTMSGFKFKYGKEVERRNSKVGDCCYNVSKKCWKHYEVEIEFQGFDEFMTECLNEFFAMSCYYGNYIE